MGWSLPHWSLWEKVNLTTRAQCKPNKTQLCKVWRKSQALAKTGGSPLKPMGWSPSPLKSTGKTSNPDFSDSNRWILKFPTDSDPESEELSNDMQHDCVGTKDPSPKLEKRSFPIEVYGKKLTQRRVRSSNQTKLNFAKFEEKVKLWPRLEASHWSLWDGAFPIEVYGKNFKPGFLGF